MVTTRLRKPCPASNRIAAAALSMTIACASLAKVEPVESTSALKLLQTEASVRTLPPHAEELLRDVITRATKAAVAVNQRASSRADVLAVLEAIQTVLVKSNFLQPPLEKDWPNTMGIALKPLTFSPVELDAVLNYGPNQKRRLFLDSKKPFYFVDCDMGSQIFMAVGERLGWDIRLVEIPKHNFIRWHLADGSTVNWDWTQGESLDDDYYRAAAATDDVRLRQLYLRSFDPRESYAYYLALIATEADSAKAVDTEHLFQKSMLDFPQHSLILNNFAWFYATHEGFKHQSALAVAYSLASWSLYRDGNHADTVACSLALDGRKQLAEAVEQFAIDHADSTAQAEGFKKNKKRISDGERCK